ncbi:hypothetical protein ABZ896_34740, partial [Streptomyces sp. NPDC047072]|uniref:hypothetical protein n=1 Tax=Streptomyces sp. NPDC047072 TaxID=3154809 RepID=UPI0033D6D974
MVIGIILVVFVGVFLVGAVAAVFRNGPTRRRARVAGSGGAGAGGGSWWAGDSGGGSSDFGGRGVSPWSHRTARSPSSCCTSRAT